MYKEVNSNYQESFIKPKYTSADVKAIYYGDDPKKRSDLFNPAGRKIAALLIALILIWLIYLYGLLLTGIWYDFYGLINAGLMKLSVYSYALWQEDSAYILVMAPVMLLAIIGGLWVVLLPTLFLPYKLINRVLKSAEMHFIRKGQLYISPISYSKYVRFENLYKEVERMEKYLASSDITDICIEDDNTVRVCVHNQLVSKDMKFSFAGLVEKIFLPEQIDFSVIDAELDALVYGKQ